MPKFHGPFLSNISECSETRFRKPSVSRCMPGKSAQASRGEAGYRIRWISVPETSMLFKKAESDAGAGDYTASRREYHIILHLEPRNLAARTGMSRVNLSVDRK